MSNDNVSNVDTQQQQKINVDGNLTDFIDQINNPYTQNIRIMNISDNKIYPCR